MGNEAAWSALFNVADGKNAEMKDAGGQHGVGPTEAHGIDKSFERTAAAGRNDRHGRSAFDRGEQVRVEARPRAVAVVGSDQQFAGAASGGLFGPGDGIAARVVAAPRTNVVQPSPLRRSMAQTVLAAPSRSDMAFNSEGSATAAELTATLSALLEQPARIANASNAAADGEWDVHGRRDARPDRPPFGDGRAPRDVEKHQFVGPLVAVSLGQFDWIAGIAEILKVGPLHNAAAGNVEAGDNTDRQAASSRRRFGGPRRLSSGAGGHQGFERCRACQKCLAHDGRIATGGLKGANVGGVADAAAGGDAHPRELPPTIGVKLDVRAGRHAVA